MSVRSEVIRVFNEILAKAKKITELPDAGAITGNEWAEIVQNGVNVKTRTSSLGSGGSTDLSGTWRHRGNYDASSNLFPTTNGTGVAGAPQAYNTYRVTVAGILGTIEPQNAPVNSIIVFLEDGAGQDETKIRIL
jgi:hypothetical protein